MRIPPELLENTATALALAAFLLSIAGLAASLLLYAFAYMAIGSIDASLSPQFDSAEAALLSASEAASGAAGASTQASESIASVADALQSYSSSTDALSSSLEGLASLPLLSIDPGIQEAAAEMGQASQHFANASQSALEMSGSAQATVLSVQEIAEDLEAASYQMPESKRSFKSALSSAGLMALVGWLCLTALFSSVALLSLSMMLSHYPNMLSRAEAATEKKQ